MAFKSLRKQQVGKYVLYAVGEIVLLIIGIMIAVSINENMTEQKNAKLRCLYLNELLQSIDYDIDDVEGNIGAFNTWNPKILDIIRGIETNKLSEIDSLDIKFGTVGNYVFFNQRSKSKIEELKYASLNLVENRELKSKLLSYQDNKIMFIEYHEKKYNLLGEDVRQYYTDNFKGFNYGKAMPHDILKIENDKRYYSLLLQRLSLNRQFKSMYERLLKDQEEIMELIQNEIDKTCADN